MKILVACEESQAVTKELRRLGHTAFSCDIQDPSGGRPDWHIKGDVTKFLEPGNFFARDHESYKFCNEYGYKIEIPARWDMIIGFPPLRCRRKSTAGWKVQKVTERSGKKQDRKLSPALLRQWLNNGQIIFFYKLFHVEHF